MSQFMTVDAETGEIKPKNPNTPIEAIYAALFEYEAEENALTFGGMLAKERNAKGLSQPDLVDKLKSEGLSITQAAISSWEKDKRKPDIVMIERLSKILSTSKLFGAYKRDNDRRHNEQQQKIKKLEKLSERKYNHESNI